MFKAYSMDRAAFSYQLDGSATKAGSIPYGSIRVCPVVSDLIRCSPPETGCHRPQVVHSPGGEIKQMHKIFPDRLWIKVYFQQILRPRETPRVRMLIRFAVNLNQIKGLKPLSRSSKWVLASTGPKFLLPTL